MFKGSRRTPVAVVALLAAALTLGVPGSALAARGATIKIHRVQYFPNVVHVSPGARILVKNLDSKQEVPHSVTADAGEEVFDTEPFLGTAVFEAPDTPGLYTFFCEIHPFMHGRLYVDG